MFNHPIYNVPIERVAEALGLRRGTGRDMYFSPMRDESRASLHIDKAKNVWHDHGAGMGGTNVQLVMLTRHCSIHEAYAFIGRLDPTLVPEQKGARDISGKGVEVKTVRDLQCYYLKNYLAQRKIPLELAQKYCKEVITYSHEKGMNFTHVGFRNNSGEWALSSPTGFKSTTKADITTITPDGKISEKPASASVAVFEGFFDFLSWQVMQSSKTPSCDVVVLNSVNNIEKARVYISAHEKAVCFLDNDAAGEKCYQKVRDMLPGGEAVDMSDLYGCKKDLNEFLQASRGYTSDMKITLHL